MDNSQASAFFESLETVLSGHANEKIKLPEQVKKWWWGVLKPYPLKTIQRALVVHSSQSVFAPKPAHIIEIINQQDGRPTADEAWPMALKASNETATLVWTDEIMNAWYHCYPVFQAGDEVGARMSFRECYNRLVTENRRTGTPAKWSVTLGHDVEQRNYEVERVEQQGLIGHDQALLLMNNSKIEGDGKVIAGLLGHDGNSQQLKGLSSEQIAQLRQLIKTPSVNHRVQKQQLQKQAEYKRREHLENQEKLLSEVKFNYAEVKS